MNPISAIAIGAIRTYQWTLRPFIGANCRFEPTCSEYAISALRTHGTLRGTSLAVWRILRCNPWSAGGYDPVPLAHISRHTCGAGCPGETDP